jgi:hypothetical protein
MRLAAVETKSKIEPFEHSSFGAVLKRSARCWGG